MTKVVIIEHEEEITIEIDGHSGYAPAGQDIVCAGVSILCQTWAELCCELAEENKIKIDEQTIYSGHFSMAICDPNGYTLYALQLIKIGFQALMEQYPEFVRVEWGENDF